ncbi:LysR family transcriptional regulator [Pseudomonas sp. PSKL.D1]|uniref:LysR family transcriptional regulator n=1 Tax=Pseudomonas sp. PSKL.D1 TaxID=3029060 RepID=UPI00238173E5|nr:LysR family transcriptional regulator [Pseudomonas sp. PSKL.D1]WDY59953.1 LysR family transcriptional regulator [Pseudomonas sp. PSKL.D1]
MLSEQRFKGLVVFVCVAEAGSFTAAAERLSLTTSAVSKSIARLEERLGIKLFERTTRRLALSDPGQNYYQTCKRMLAALDEAELDMHADQTEPRGRVRIDLPASYGKLRVMPVLIDFIAEHELLMPHITLTDRFVDQVEEGIDVLVRIGGPETWPAGVERRLIGVQRQIFCAAPDYLQRKGEPTTERDLHEHGCVLYGRNDGGVYPLHFPGPQAGDGEQRIIPGRIAIGDAQGQLAMVLAGLGIAQLPTWLVQAHLDEGTLVHILPELTTSGLPINIAWLKSRQSLPKVRALVDTLYNALSN